MQAHKRSVLLVRDTPTYIRGGDLSLVPTPDAAMDTLSAGEILRLDGPERVRLGSKSVRAYSLLFEGERYFLLEGDLGIQGASGQERATITSLFSKLMQRAVVSHR